MYQDFYSDLYTAVLTVRSEVDFFLDFLGPSDYVNTDSTEDGNSPFSIPDIKQAIMSMENNKKPLSPSLYVMYMETMVRAITQCRLLSGCPVPGPDSWKCLCPISKT